jgi:hypothetical protein
MTGDRRRVHTRRESEIQAIEERVKKASTEAAKVAARSTAIRAASGYFLLLFVLFVSAIVWQRANDSTVRTAALATCSRVNKLRVEESNRNAQVMWAALYRSYQRETKLARGPEAELHRTSAAYLKKSIEQIRWTPMTNCKAAVRSPKQYDPPDPKPFTDRFLDFSVVPR